MSNNQETVTGLHPQPTEQADERTANHLSSNNSIANSHSSHSSSANDEDGDRLNDLDRCSTRHTAAGDAPIQPISSLIEVPDNFYDRLPRHRKLIIVILLSFSAFLAPVSSTSVLAATPEVAATYNTTGSICNLVNALYLLFMGLSPCFWGPMSQVYGRRNISLITGFGFIVASVGTALSPNLGSFFFFRLFTAFEGTSFLLNGAAVIRQVKGLYIISSISTETNASPSYSDIFRPTERGTATGWFMSGTLVGPAFGPFLGGIIVTFTSWRVIFWLQTALAGIATIGVYFLLPETIFHKKNDDLAGYGPRKKALALSSMINPWRVLKLWEYPNLVLVGFSSSSLVWNMYSLLTPIRYVLNPRYHLTTPLQGGLFYLAPGLGYLAGTFVGGRYADHIVKKYIRKRGVRVPEDRLYSALPFMGVVIPGSVLIYGWAVQKDVGGIPLTVIVLFIQGLAQLFCFPSLNTYCLDVMPGRGAEVIAGNYAIRYLFAAAGTAVVLPAIESIGVGWFSTISVFFVLGGSACTWLTTQYGKQWRDAIDAKHRRKTLKTDSFSTEKSTEKTDFATDPAVLNDERAEKQHEHSPITSGRPSRNGQDRSLDTETQMMSKSDNQSPLNKEV
ncbi:major facilitator superfamily domain-containing protein [Xylariaceae sp. FL1019]|nr:major facilitator superfamily domain-containing protein [Xylariaceae sp. FL1019]